MLKFRNVTLRRGVKVVLEGTEFTLNPGEKASLIGRNGAGKSSLFSLLAGRLQADAGDVEIPPHWRIAEVAQEMPTTEAGATEYVLQGDARLMAAREQLAAAEAADDGHAIAEAHVELDEAGAFDATSRAQSLLLGLGFGTDRLDLPVNEFSGGWRMRLQLARALMAPGELLLLDEPTNHLDLDALVWLEAWLKRFDGTLVVISHDREFLDAVTRVTLHLDEGTVTRYGGNYTAFETMRAERMSQQQAAFDKQQERIAHLQKFIDRFKAKATKARQAQSRVKALARMERLAPVLTASDFHFEFQAPAQLPNPMLVLDGVACGYPAPEPDEAPRIIVRDVVRTVLAGQRIGILGANGQGKSTLVKTIAGVLSPVAGRMTEGKGLAIGYFAQQEMDLLAHDDTPMQKMVRLAREVSPNAREQELRNFLGRFRFDGEMVQQRIGTLSGGERARLVLATIVWQRPNLLLLDEPTNHLDLTTREALSIALNEFDGTVMLVSHDRALLRETCDAFWIVADGVVRDWDGDLDDYQKWLLERGRTQASSLSGSRGVPAVGESDQASGNGGAAAASASAASRRGGEMASGARAAAASAQGSLTPPLQHAASREASPSGGRDDRKARAQARQKLADATRPMRSEITQIDQRLAKLTAERSQCEGAMAAGDLPGSEIAELGRRLNHISAEIAMLEERWLDLSGEVERLTAQMGAE